MLTNKDFIPNKQLRRVFAIIQLLIRNRNGLTISEITEKLLDERDIPVPSLRTLQRDINEIEALGYDLRFDNDHRYILQNREEIVGAAFAPEEVQALQMSRDIFRYFEGTHLKRSIDSAIDLVIGAQKTNFTKCELVELEDNFMVHLGPHRNLLGKGDIIDDIVHAINNRYLLEIKYRKPNSSSLDVILSPYRLVLYHDTLYLLARKQGESGPLQVYHVSRIENAAEQENTFERDSDLLVQYEEYLSHSFGIYTHGDLTDVIIRFDRSVIYALKERVWHHSQEIIEENDSVILKLKVLDNKEFSAWVLGWGKAVLEIFPESLSVLVREMRG